MLFSDFAMTDELLCPDCHGVIGATPGGEVQACTCFNAETYKAPSEETFHAAEEAQAAAAEKVVTVEKVCRICGKNVAGHRRIRDKLGYLCLPCSKSEDEAAAEGLVRCGECNKRLKPAGLTDYHGTMICKKCYMDHQEMTKFKAPPPNLNAHMDEQRKSAQRTLWITAACVVFLLLVWLGLFR